MLRGGDGHWSQASMATRLDWNREKSLCTLLSAYAFGVVPARPLISVFMRDALSNEGVLVSSSRPVLSAIRAAFFVITVGGTVASVVFSGVQPRPLLCGLFAGIMSAVAALALSRFSTARSWITVPVVLIQVLSLQFARSGHAGSQWPLFLQFGGLALAVYGAAIVFLRIGLLGSAQWMNSNSQ